MLQATIQIEGHYENFKYTTPDYKEFFENGDLIPDSCKISVAENVFAQKELSPSLHHLYSIAVVVQ